MEIKVQHPKQILIHRIIKEDSVDGFTLFLRNFALARNYIPHIFWCDGYLLDFSSYQDSEYLEKEEFEKGIWHISHLNYCVAPKYFDKIEFPNGGHLLISNRSHDPVLKDMVKFLEERDKHE